MSKKTSDNLVEKEYYITITAVKVYFYGASAKLSVRRPAESHRLDKEYTVQAKKQQSDGVANESIT